MNTSSTRDRLLLATAQLLAESGDRTVSTRRICELAGVQAPTLHHHFGSKQGLIDAVINHGSTQYVTPDHEIGDCDDPLTQIRRGWDRHVQFGLEHPTFYALLYGEVKPGIPCAITAPAEAMLRDLLTVAARHGLLCVAPADAAEQILAANVGVTLSLITRPEESRDMGLSNRVCEAALDAVVAHLDTTDTLQPVETLRATAAIALAAALDRDGSGLTYGEPALLRELLARLSRAPASESLTRACR